MSETTSTGDASASSTTPARPLLLVAGGALLARLVVVDHAPSALDAATVVVALLALVVARSWHDARGARADVWALAGMILVVGPSVAAAARPWHALISSPTVIAPFVVALAVRAGGDALRPFVLAALAAGGAVHATVALAQRFITWPDALARSDALALDPTVRLLLSTLRPLGLSLSPDLMSGLVALGLAAALALAPRAPIGRAIVALVVVVDLGAILAARSTTTLLGLGVAVVFAMARLGRARLALGGAALAVAVFVVAGRGVERALHSLDERWLNWRSALGIVVERPFTGVGPGGFAEAYEGARIAGANETLYAHSWPLHLAAEVGVLAPLLVLVALLVVARGRLVARALSARDVVVEAGCLLLLLRSLVDFDAQVGQSAAAIGAALGLIAARVPNAEPATTDARVRRVVVGLSLVVVLATLPLVPLLVSRERALAPFARGASPGPTDVTALFEWASAHPGDAIARTLAGRLHVELAAVCHPSHCAATRERARTFLDGVVSEPGSTAADFTSRARLALLLGDRAGAIADATDALLRDRSDELAHAVRLAAIDDDDARRGAFLDAIDATFTDNLARAVRLRAEALRAEAVRAETPRAEALRVTAPSDGGSGPEPVDE